MHFHFGSRGCWLVLFCCFVFSSLSLLLFKAPTSDIFSLSGSELSLSPGTGRRMRLCCADGEKCDIHNAFPIRGCHAWTHLATCQRETDSGRMRTNCLSARGEVVRCGGTEGWRVKLPSKLNQSTEWRWRGREREREGEENTQTDKESWATLEWMRAGSQRRTCPGLESRTTWPGNLHATCENPRMKPAFLPHCGREFKTL